MKRLQYFAMLCVFVTLFTGVAWGDVNSIETLQQAFTTALSATNDTTIKLTGDIAKGDTNYIEIGKSNNTAEHGKITLDLNGYTISTALDLYCDLTIDDSSENKTGAISVDYKWAIWLNNSVKLNVIAGTFVAHSWVIVARDSTALNISGGVLSADQEGGTALSANGTTGEKPDITITGGELKGVELGFYLPSGTLNITGGKISGQTGIYFKSNTLKISGGEIIGNGASADYKYYGNGAFSTGDALVLDFCGYPNGIGTISVTGGTFTSENAQAIGAYVYSTNANAEGNAGTDEQKTARQTTAESQKVEKFITGGIFNTDPSKAYSNSPGENHKTYVALNDGYKSVQGGERYYVVSSTATVSADLTATSIDYGKTLADSTISGTIKIGDVVIDSSDYTLAWASPDTVPTVAGGEQRYEVTVSPAINGTSSFTVKITVNKVDSSVTTAPTAVASLVANGTAQALITAGTAENGEMQYALGSDDQTAPTTGYSTTIPTGTDAGEYYVWYKVVGGDNYNDTEAKCIPVTITAKAAATLSSFDVIISGDTALTATYGTSATKTFTASVKAGYSDGTTSALTSGYTLAWSTTSTDLADHELSFSNGTLTVSDLADVGTYNVPITATVTSGSIKGTATVTAKVTVNNVAPVLSSTASTVTAKQGERITNVTVTATKGANIEWSTNGTLPTGLTYTTTATTFVIAGTVSASADVKTYDYSVIATNNISSATQKVTFTINSADVVVVQSDDQNPEKATIKAEDLKNATAEQLAEALTGKTELAIEGAVNDTEFAETLTKLASTGITALDLSSVSGLTTVDLKSNSKIETLDLGTNSSVKTVELSSTSSVKSMSLAKSKVTTVNAEGCTSLTSVDVSGNTTIQTLTLTNTGVGDLNVASCDNLQTLETGSCESLEKVTLSGCKNLKTFKTSNSSNLKSIEGYQDCADTLTELDVSSCSLLRIDLANFKVLTNPNLGGQRRTGASILRRFSWWRFFFGNWWPSEATEQEGDVDYTKLIKITKASDSQGDISYSYNSDGEIEFVRTPTEFAYEFDSQLPDNSASEFKASAAAGGTMDVTISGSKGEADSDNPGGSGGGCETGIGILALSLCMILFINKKH